MGPKRSSCSSQCFFTTTSIFEVLLRATDYLPRGNTLQQCKSAHLNKKNYLQKMRTPVLLRKKIGYLFYSLGIHAPLSMNQSEPEWNAPFPVCRLMRASYSMTSVYTVLKNNLGTQAIYGSSVMQNVHFL